MTAFVTYYYGCCQETSVDILENLNHLLLTRTTLIVGLNVLCDCDITADTEGTL